MWSLIASLAALAAVGSPPSSSHPSAYAAPTAPASGYVKYSDVAGEVVKVSDQGFTLRMTWQTVSGANRGRYSLTGGHQHHHPGRHRSPHVVVHHQDHPVLFADDGLVRWHHLADAGGKSASAVEQDQLKRPPGAPGWAANRSALKPGQIVEVVFVRPKSIPAAKVTEKDLRVRYAVIWREDPTPPKPAPGGKK